LITDKKKHLIAGFVLSTMGLVYWPLYALGYIAGIAKEVYDSTGRGCVEAADVAYTWVGATVATMIGVFIF